MNMEYEKRDYDIGKTGVGRWKWRRRRGGKDGGNGYSIQEIQGWRQTYSNVTIGT